MFLRPIVDHVNFDACVGEAREYNVLLCATEVAMFHERGFLASLEGDKASIKAVSFCRSANIVTDNKFDVRL